MNQLLLPPRFLAGSLTINGTTISAPRDVLLAILIFGLLSLVWIVFDARRRGKSGCLALILGIALWPFSLFLWLWLHPPAPGRRSK